MGLFGVKNTINGLILMDCTIDRFVEFDIWEFYEKRKMDTIMDMALFTRSIRDEKSHKFMILDGYLYTFRYSKEILYMLNVPFNKDGEYLPPDDLERFMREHDVEEITYVSATVASLYENVLKRYASQVGLNYIYDNEKVAKMEGSSFSNPRSKVNKFIKSYEDIEVVMYDESMYDDFMYLYSQWRKENEEKFFRIVDKHLYDKSLRFHDEIFHTHFGVYIKENGTRKLIGMSGYIYVNNESCYCMHRKALKAYTGLAEFLQKNCSVLALKDGFPFMLDGNDGGASYGLRPFKSKFDPITYDGAKLKLKKTKGDSV